ncbi:phenazine biosynthesis protein PhzF family [Desulfonispora thiosulfatigenes DSM 11270]|uniref:Phenazine biosynthesis protein PhzF family n=1 Tax=Desulfonispora thiosulfatigenes DSM 11270 TaxID=656914 RepID=A0A1W1UGB8_DESTI|nr:PhzF family phenazine biosynthesis protein [Desulfonispora thiosulfatigenes]SMB79851.1 phenazine biosynthesis protein PhzF family [Desulfonispora thiosulfatigenes DSM 11270]
MRQYVVDAFTDKVFEGNPAAVCIMDEWLPESTMLKITLENNLSETAFAVKEGEDYRLRWFTPGGEIDLCGHATLATAYVITKFYNTKLEEIQFKTLSGVLKVINRGDLYEMDFPAYDLQKINVTDEMEEAIGIRPIEAFKGRDLLLVLENEENIRKLKPNMQKIKKLDGLLLHVTAPGRDYDCVSRSFAPKIDVPEDPVCGSGHCHIIPYWAAKTGNNELVAYQASRRSGILYCEFQGERVKLSGNTALYSVADINF